MRKRPTNATANDGGGHQNHLLPFHLSAASQAERIAAIQGALDVLESSEPRRAWASLELALLWIERIQFARSSRGEEVFSRPWSQIAKQSRCSASTIRGLFDAAEAAGLLEIRESRYVTGGQRPNEIVLHIEACKRLAMGRGKQATATVATSCDNTEPACHREADRVPSTGSPLPSTGSPLPSTGSPLPSTGSPIGNTCFSHAEKKAIPPPPAPATATVATRHADTEHTWVEVEENLISIKFGSWRSLVAKAKLDGRTPGELLHAIDKYRVNTDRLRGPGSIVQWMNTGVWPHADLREPTEAAESLQAAKLRQSVATDERLKYVIIIRGRKAGRSDNEIARELHAAGLDW